VFSSDSTVAQKISYLQVEVGRLGTGADVLCGLSGKNL